MVVDDVGVFAALAFARPDEWIGRAIDLAGDEVTPRRIAEAIGAAIGRPVPYVHLPIETIRRAGEEFAFACEWLNTLGRRADISAARRIHPGLMDLHTWLERTGAAQIEAFFEARQEV
ncbi:NmrA family NAD(P)-binding protein [Streptosporangium sp. LJ11]|uniref:NmrA family NAD(P)-binding protein n=1 Tax=Streptosporangium sp. LJ11 TaxID=3436927 RepID=UPI003F79A3C9